MRSAVLSPQHTVHLTCISYFFLSTVLQIQSLYSKLWHGIWSGSNAFISGCQGLSGSAAKCLQYVNVHSPVVVYLHITTLMTLLLCSQVVSSKGEQI